MGIKDSPINKSNMAKVTKMNGEKPKFKENVNYKWEPEDVFEITGLEFSHLLTLTRILATSTEGVAPVNIVEANRIMESLLVAGVEAGVIKEQSEVPQSTEPIPGVQLPS